MKRAWLLLLPLTFACVQPERPYVWEGNGVRVKAVEIRQVDARYADYRIEVSEANLAYCFGSGAFGSHSERLASFSNVIAFADYVLVPASCGGGNASKCRGWQLFGRPVRGGLRWMGYFSGKWDGSKAVPYEDGFFYDTGDMLEINDLVSHASSPRYVMAYTDAIEDGMAFQPQKTWELNAEQYKASQDDAPGLLFRAGLAKLCGKTAELKAVQAKADKALSVYGRQLFAKALGQVKNNNILPNPFIPVADCPPDRKG